VTLSDFRAAQTRVRPSGMREVALELPKVTWADVGGHSAIKQRLKEAVEWPQKHPEMLARMGAKVSPHVLKRDPTVLPTTDTFFYAKGSCLPCPLLAHKHWKGFRLV
jgi:SpoVK/Ycf46/Vps4 family AAA+-type ATPase